MNKTVIVLLTFIIALSTASAQAASATPNKYVVLDFLHQMLDYGTTADTPSESRMATAVAAAQELAAALGEDIDESELELSARNPQVFAPESDTAFTWSGGVWQAFSRNTYNYSSGKKNSVRTDNWTGSWNNFSLTSWTYSGNQINYYIYQTWNAGTSSWVNNLKMSFTYDGSSRILTALSETWNGTSYDQASRVVYTYNGSGRVATVTNQSWIGAWQDISRTTYTYDGSGNETLSLTETWLGIWSNSSQTISTYAGSNLATETLQHWNGAGWDNYSKDVYSYDGSNNQTLDVHSNYQASNWVVADVDTSKYDGGNHLIQNVQWQVSPNTLDKEDYTYNGSGNMTLMISQTYDGSWTNVSKYVITYTSLATKIESAPLPKDFALMQNHPNPFNPTTTIRYNLGRAAIVRLEIHNVLGQLVRVLEDSEQGAGVYESTWDGRNDAGREVASGVYFYSLKAGDYTETRKMVLSR